jgi:asparagine N-glycosylation enzyme membrane subunit Stt3
VSSTTSLRGRSGSFAAAALIGIGLTLLVEQVVHIDNPSLFLIAFGGALLFAYFNQPRRASNLIVVGGVLSGLGLGSLLSSHDLTPEFLHGALMAGSLAIGFASICLFGDTQKHRWAMWPAAVFGIIAWFSFVTQAPWLKDTFGMLFHFSWPLLLVAVGLWLIERSRHQVSAR